MKARVPVRVGLDQVFVEPEFLCEDGAPRVGPLHVCVGFPNWNDEVQVEVIDDVDQ